MRVAFTANGIHLPEVGLWLDATHDAPEAGRVTWVSHGHSDHARGRHQRVLATGPTLDFFRLRNPEPVECEELEFGRPIAFGRATLTAFPAGHILGAASLLVEFEGERLLYTGDIKVQSSLLADREPVEIPACNHLIVESTFGLPVFHFLAADEARGRIVEFARRCLEEGDTPVFIGYALGRGQEIAHALCQAGIPTALHGAIARLLPVYEQAGFSFPGWSAYQARDTKGKALVVTPSFRANLEASVPGFRLAYVSGWAAMDHARSRTGAEELIPYSDHGGFGELVEICERSGAREIDVIHGYTQPFAKILCQRGLNARSPFATSARDTEEAGE